MSDGYRLVVELDRSNPAATRAWDSATGKALRCEVKMREPERGSRILRRLLDAKLKKEK